MNLFMPGLFVKNFEIEFLGTTKEVIFIVVDLLIVLFLHFVPAKFLYFL